MNNFERDTAKVGRYVRDGQAHFLAQMIADQKLDYLSEFELRQNMAMALVRSAEIREQLKQQAGFGNPVLQSEAISVDQQMNMMGFASQRRQQALDISWNPEGKPLLEQIREFITPQSLGVALERLYEAAQDSHNHHAADSG